MSDSVITKKALAASIKELMAKKSLQKISVADIVNNCGLNRQTFYYHFKDKYDLVNWIYYMEVISPITENRTYEDWSGGIYDILSIMKRDKAFYENALNVSGQNAFQEYLFDVTKELMLQVVEEIAKDKHIDIKDKEFISEFCTYGLVGIIIKWAKMGMVESPEHIYQHIQHFIEDSAHIATVRYMENASKNTD